MEPSSYLIKKIFIASPGDLNEERYIFREIVKEINENKAHTFGFHFEALGWEDTLPGKGRPQELINQDLSKSDLVIFLFWERWGTPSGRYSSGTEEEFNLSLTLNEQVGKPEIWVFFKQSKNENDKIHSFRKDLEVKQQLLYKTFVDSKSWEKIIRQLLNKWIDTLTDSDSGFNKQRREMEKILFSITHRDFINGNPYDGEIYFTIADEESFKEWTILTDEMKKQLMFNLISEYFYLILGVKTYKGIFRYKDKYCRMIYLGMMTFTNGATIDEILYCYIPQKLNQVIEQYNDEISNIQLQRFFGSNAQKN